MALLFSVNVSAVTETYDFVTLLNGGYTTINSSGTKSFEGKELKVISSFTNSSGVVGANVGGRIAALYQTGNGNNFWMRDASRPWFVSAGKTSFMAFDNLKAGDIVKIIGATYPLTILCDNVQDAEGNDVVNGTTFNASYGEDAPLTLVAKADGYIYGSYGPYTAIKKIIVETSAAETANDPIVTITGANGNERTVTINPNTGSIGSEQTAYYTLDGSDPTKASTEYTAPFTVSQTTTVKAIAYCGDAASNIVSVEVEAGTTIALNKPVLNVVNMKVVSGIYSPFYKATFDNSNLIGSPTATLTATFDGSDVSGKVKAGSFIPTTNGVLTVTISADGYESATISVPVYSQYNKVYESADYGTLEGEEAIKAVIGDNWTSTTGRWANWNKENATYGDAYVIYSYSGEEEGANIYIDKDEKLRANKAIQFIESFGFGRNISSGTVPVFINNTGTTSDITLYRINASKGADEENFVSTYVISNEEGTSTFGIPFGANLCQATVYSPILPTYTATFVNGAKWENVYAYTFNTELNGAWPGQKIEKTGTTTINEVEYDVYTYTVKAEAAPASIIFNNGNGGDGNQTADLAFEDGKEYSYGLPTIEEKMDYYIVGSMTEWGPKAEYKMALNEGAETEEYVIKLNLTTTSQFKVAKSNGSTIADDAWYPTGMGNNYGENGEITVDGEYTIYFRPNADGGDDWFYKYIYAVAPSAEVDMTNLIVNADLTGTDGWDTTGTKGYHNVGGVVTASNDAQFDFKQTIANLPAGKYKVTAQAAYRFGGDEQAEYDAIQAGTNTKLASLYATVGEKTVNALVQNRWDGASDTNLYDGDGGITVVNEKYVPNSTAAMKAWFTAGKYVNELEFNVPADGDVTIGIVKTAKPGSDYTVIGPWTLTRIGDAEAEPEPETPAPGTDMTDKIVNPSFETGDLTGWTVGNSSDTGVRENSNATYATEGCDGNYLFNTWWQGIPITQTIADLPNGKYELKALMASDAGDHLYLLANGEHSAVFGSPNKGVFVEQSMQFYVTNKTATIGAIGGNENGTFNEAGYFWYKVDNFRLTFVEALPNIADIELPEGKMSNAAAQAMADAKEAGDVLALLDAVQKAKESIDAYAKAKAALDAMKNIMGSTNVYTAEALEAYNAIYTAKLAAYDDGTMSDEDAKALENPELRTGWQHNASVVVDDLLLSTWSIGETKAKDYDTALYINTWSSEGEGDGTNFLVPFFEYWTGDGESLAANTLSAMLTNVPEGEYTVTAWVRVRAKNGFEAPATGITFQVNDGEAVDACAGDQVGTSQFFLKEFTATGVVGADGVLNIKFNVAADNNISWLSFKNVKYTKKAVEPEANYYIVGNMTNWAVSEDYKMTLNQAAETTEYMFTMDLTTTSQFKVVKVEGETQTWIPDGMGNAFGENGEIAEDGNYTIYFRPKADGGEDWFYNVIYALKNTSVGISQMEAEALKGNVYNLNGQKVTKVQKGLYIVNGKKTIKK